MDSESQVVFLALEQQKAERQVVTMAVNVSKEGFQVVVKPKHKKFNGCTYTMDSENRINSFNDIPSLIEDGRDRFGWAYEGQSHRECGCDWVSYGIKSWSLRSFDIKGRLLLW